MSHEVELVVRKIIFLNKILLRSCVFKCQIINCNSAISVAICLNLELLFPLILQAWYEFCFMVIKLVNLRLVEFKNGSKQIRFYSSIYCVLIVKVYHIWTCQKPSLDTCEKLFYKMYQQLLTVWEASLGGHNAPNHLTKTSVCKNEFILTLRYHIREYGDLAHCEIFQPFPTFEQ